ncbi:LptF/LptG family permease [Henriciella aquimarina]|uniref:LptF/LptG family permease n=1 Tax=Henriciella aquimarina TaxID=545261 RepID=UPI001F29FCA8|nr:LptF/LptG family permease [Henriciella aquimarina]
MIGLNRIQRYILLQCVLGLAMVMAIFIVTILLVDVVEQLRTVGGDVELSPVTAVSLSLMKLPGLAEQTLPFAILVAAMIAYSRLNARSELSVIRASGLSAWQFLTPVTVMCVVVGLFAMMVLNPLGARLSDRFESLRNDLLIAGGVRVDSSESDVWMRQGDGNTQIVIHAESVDETGQVFRGVKMLEQGRVYQGGRPTDRFEFVRRIDAEKARIIEGFWQMESLIENIPGSPPQQMDSLAIPTDLDPDTLLDRFTSPNTIGFWSLPAFIKQTREAGLDSSRFAVRLYSLTAIPVFYTAMGLIGAIVCLRLSRLGGTSRLIAAGGLAATGVFFIMQFSASLGASGALPPIIAAWSPALFALFASLAVLSYREDG